MRIALAILTSLALATFSIPVAAAEPQCLQVYPWSELCQGDLDDLCFGPACLQADLCILDRDCFQPPAPPVECLQVYPWSELCVGDVGAFVCYYACDLVTP